MNIYDGDGPGNMTIENTYIHKGKEIHYKAVWCDFNINITVVIGDLSINITEHYTDILGDCDGRPHKVDEEDLHYAVQEYIEEIITIKEDVK